MKSWSPNLSVILTVGSLTIALGTWVSIASGHVCWSAFPAALLVWCLSAAMGIALSAWLSLQPCKIDSIGSTVFGFFVVNGLLFAGTVLLRLGIVTSAAGTTLVTGLVAATAWKQRRIQLHPLDKTSIAALVVAILFATLWSRQNLTGFTIAPTTITSVPWLDTHYHSVHVAHFAFAKGRALGTDPLLATVSLPPYHYTSYMIPSLVVRLSGISAYLGTVAVYAPLGTLLTGLSAHCFGRLVCGPLGSLLGTVFCLGITDPTFYLLENRWLSYFFFQQIAASGAFGAALMLLAWSYCIRGVVEQLRRWLFVGLTLCSLVAVFKSQIFLTYSFGLLLFASLNLPRVKIGWRMVLGALASSVFLVCAYRILPAIPRAPTLMLGTTAGPSNLHWALSKLGGARQAAILELAGNYPAFLLIAVPVFLAFTFGLLVPLCLLLANSSEIRRTLRTGSLWFLWTAGANYLVVTVGLDGNAGYGDPFEIVHKTFVWPYLAISVWCGCAIATWLQNRDARIQRIAGLAVIPAATLWTGLHVFQQSNQLQTAFVYPGYESGRNLTLPRDAFEVAEYLRKNSPTDSIVQYGAPSTFLMAESFTDRHAYVAYPSGGRNVPAEAVGANELVAAMLTAPNEEVLRAKAALARIDYLVLVPGQHSAWEQSLHPVFQRGDYRIYRI